jgi:hypothetical protein
MPRGGAAANVEKVAQMYNSKKAEWEKKNRGKELSSKISWDLHEEAQNAISTRETKTRGKSLAIPTGNRNSEYKGRKPNDRFKHATLGDGVNLRQSTMAGATAKNKGLFACRAFSENELITEYTGPRITREQALELRKQGRASHVKGINYDVSIDGDQQPIAGQGIAQFANDSTREGKNNAKFDIKFDKDHGEMRVFIKALRLLRANEEIFIGYGKGYWPTDRITGKKIYDEDFAEKYMERVREQEELAEEQKVEQEKRRAESKERARIKKKAKDAEELRLLEIKEEEKQVRADERAKEREIESAKRAVIRERERGLRRQEREIEQEQKRKVKAHDWERSRAQRELMAQMNLQEQVDFEQRLADKKEDKRLERVKIAAAKRAEEQARLDAMRASAADAEDAKKERAEEEHQHYRRLADKWEKAHGGQDITSSAAWELWDQVRMPKGGRRARS